MTRFIVLVEAHKIAKTNTKYVAARVHKESLISLRRQRLHELSFLVAKGLLYAIAMQSHCRLHLKHNLGTIVKKMKHLCFALLFHCGLK